MSIRTVVEINHDYLPALRDNPQAMIDMLEAEVAMLRVAVSEVRSALDRLPRKGA